MLVSAFNFYIAILLLESSSTSTTTATTATVTSTITSSLAATTANETKEAPPIETGLRLFFLKDGTHPMQTSNFESFYGTRFEKLVILLTGVHLLEKVTIKVQSDIIPRVTLHYVGDQTDISCSCEPKTFAVETATYTYDCIHYSNRLTLEGESVVEDILIQGYDTRIIFYIGCFKPLTSINATLFHKLSDCEHTCDKHDFYGVNSIASCICLDDLNEMIPVKLNFCMTFCSTAEYNLCGSKHYISVYSKNETFQKHHEPVTPDWNCTFWSESCPACQDGRNGPTCESIDCTVNNGNCGHLECQSITLWNYVEHSICTCKYGFYIGNDSDCHDVDECSYENLCIYASCMNEAGTYSCECWEGLYNVDPITCDDVDECNESTSCDEESTLCNNVYGDYECMCKDGYVRDENSSPKDDCEVKCLCNQTTSECVKNGTGYKCKCLPGYYIDNITCISRSSQTPVLRTHSRKGYAIGIDLINDEILNILLAAVILLLIVLILRFSCYLIDIKFPKLKKAKYFRRFRRYLIRKFRTNQTL